MSRRLIYIMVALLLIVLLAFFIRQRGLLPSLGSLPGLGSLTGANDGVTIQDSTGQSVTVQGQQVSVRPGTDRMVLERELPGGQAPPAAAEEQQPVATSTPIPVQPTQQADPLPTPIPLEPAATNTPIPVQPTATPVPIIPPTNTPIVVSSPFVTFVDHTVTDGQTAAEIARIHNTDTNLMAQYGIYQNLIYPGQVLSVPVLNPAACNGQIHIVAAGQNVFRLAQQYGTTQEAIRDTNGLSGDYLIKVGQPLCIPN